MTVNTDGQSSVLLSFVVPSYNSQDYLDRCIDSMLPAPDDVEIIIVNDGSTDGTQAMADQYASTNPGHVRVVNKVNGGHGSAINSGLAAAQGRYFKVVDSDDWVDSDAYEKLLTALRGYPTEAGPDLVVTNFVYEKEGKRHKHAMTFRNVFDTDRVVGWEQTGRFRRSQYLLMHALTYRTGLLREVGLQLPEHTFYVDNLYAYVPMARVRRLAYVDADLYRYYIGREGQSVQEEVMIKRIDQQLRVNRLMIDNLPSRDAPMPRKQRWYLEHYLGVMCAVSSILLIKSGTRANLAEKSKLWRELRAADQVTWRRLRNTLMGNLVNMPGRSGRKFSVACYTMARQFFGFN